MLNLFLVLLTALLVIGAGELVRGKCRQMLRVPKPLAIPVEETASATATVR